MIIPDYIKVEGDYSYHFLWCLYAIVWGIQRWDEANTEALAS